MRPSLSNLKQNVAALVIPLKDRNLCQFLGDAAAALTHNMSLNIAIDRGIVILSEPTAASLALVAHHLSSLLVLHIL